MTTQGTLLHWSTLPVQVSELPSCSVRVPSCRFPRPSSLSGHSSRLTNHLMVRHNKDAPPDGVVYVHYELELVHILGIDELKQTLTALVYIDEVGI